VQKMLRRITFMNGIFNDKKTHSFQTLGSGAKFQHNDE